MHRIRKWISERFQFDDWIGMMIMVVMGVFLDEFSAKFVAFIYIYIYM